MNTINPSDKEVKQIKTFDVEFIVGQNDLDFYQFMNENHALPDIITCCRFSLHDAAPLKGSLMDLSTTEVCFPAVGGNIPWYHPRIPTE